MLVAGVPYSEKKLVNTKTGGTPYGPSHVTFNSNKEISDEDWDNFVYNRKSLRGKHLELWQHLSGCRQWIKVERDTATHEIFKTMKANEDNS